MSRDYDGEVSRIPHALKVIAYNDHFGCHVCEFDGPGRRTALVDLFVNGDFPEDVSPASLIGKTVSVAYAHGFIWIGSDVRIVPENAEAA